jgi:hypothetical protein
MILVLRTIRNTTLLMCYTVMVCFIINLVIRCVVIDDFQFNKKINTQ